MKNLRAISADTFLAAVQHVSQARIEIKEVPWARIDKRSPRFYKRPGTAHHIVHRRAASGETVRRGIPDLQILKTTDSAFAGFLKDAYTTLAETTDRLLGTVLEADWLYTGRRSISTKRTHGIRALLAHHLSRRIRAYPFSKLCTIWRSHGH